MAKKKKKKITKTERHKQSLLRQVRRMEANAYWFEGDIRKQIKELSPQKARFFTTDTLYQMAKTADITGKTMTGTERRAIERKERAKKAAETKREKKRKTQEWIDAVNKAAQEAEEKAGKPDTKFPDGEVPDITDDILNNFSEFIDFLEGPPSDEIVTKSGKNVPKPPDLAAYEESAKKFLRRIFEEEKRKDPAALANRLLDNYSEIDELMGVVECSGYKEAVRRATDAIARIIRGVDHLSDEDRDVAEAAANMEGWDEEA